MWSIISILIVMNYPNNNFVQKLFRGFTMSILLLGFLTLRKNGLLTEFFGPSVSFHLYHIIIAIWIFAITSLIKKPHIWMWGLKKRYFTKILLKKFLKNNFWWLWTPPRIFWWIQLFNLHAIILKLLSNNHPFTIKKALIA